MHAVAFQPDHALLRKVYEDHVARSEREYGPGDTRTAEAARDLGFFLKEAGDTKAAIPAFAKALQIDQAKYGAEARKPLAGMIALASVSGAKDAETLLRRALASPSMDSQLAVPALSSMGDLRMAAGDSKAAADYWRLALQHAEAVYGKESDEVEKILYSLARTVDANQSVELLDRALTIARQKYGDRHPETATCDLNLSRALIKSGRQAEAAEKAREAVAAFEASLGIRHPRTAAALSVLAEALLARGDKAAAKPLYQRAWEIDRQALGEGDPRTLSDARALRALQKPE